MRHRFFKLMLASAVLGFSVNVLAAVDTDNPASYGGNDQMDQLNTVGESKENSKMPALPNKKETAQQLRDRLSNPQQQLQNPQQPPQQPGNEELD